MTKKDYKVIAKVIKESAPVFTNNTDSISKLNIILQLSAMFFEDNPNFDVSKFYEACY